VDRAFWITWYNLPEAGQLDYLVWLHRSYLPEMLKRPGYLWAAHYVSLDKSQVRRHSTGPRFGKEDPAVPTGDLGGLRGRLALTAQAHDQSQALSYPARPCA